MAKIIPKKDIPKLPDKTEAWEEYIMGRGTRKVYIFQTSRFTPNKFFVEDALIGSSVIRSIYDKEFRYWDAEPTLDEKYKEPWR